MDISAAGSATKERAKSTKNSHRAVNRMVRRVLEFILVFIFISSSLQLSVVVLSELRPAEEQPPPGPICFMVPLLR